MKLKRSMTLKAALVAIALAGASIGNACAETPYAPADDDAALAASSLAGTTWRGHSDWAYAKGGTDSQIWDVEFRADGVMHYVYEDSGRAFDNGHWRQRGAVLFWDTNSMFGAAIGLIRGDEIQGTKINIRGDKGDFSFKRVSK